MSPCWHIRLSRLRTAGSLLLVTLPYCAAGVAAFDLPIKNEKADALPRGFVADRGADDVADLPPISPLDCPFVEPLVPPLPVLGVPVLPLTLRLDSQRMTPGLSAPAAAAPPVPFSVPPLFRRCSLLVRDGRGASYPGPVRTEDDEDGPPDLDGFRTFIDRLLLIAG